MAQFTVNPLRFDPYKNFKFRVKWDGRYVAGVSKVSALKRTTEVVKHRDGADPQQAEGDRIERRIGADGEQDAVPGAHAGREEPARVGVGLGVQLGEGGLGPAALVREPQGDLGAAGPPQGA